MNELVQTVLGPVAPSELGVTLMHEHFFVSSAAANYREPADPRDLAKAHSPVSHETIEWVRGNLVNCVDNLIMMDEAEAIDEGDAVAAAGGRSVIDVTPVGVGRNPLGVVRVAQATGLHVVMGCGYYVQATHPPSLDGVDVDAITEEILSDFRDGIRGTGVCAGVIGEIGCSWPLYDSERKVLSAAAAAQRELGAALYVHPGRHRAAPDEILALLDGERVELSKVVLCHVDRTAQAYEDVERWAQAGCVIAYDLFGVQPPNKYYDDLAIVIPSDEERLETIERLAAAGHGSQVVISHDVCFKHQLRKHGGWGRDHILRAVVPRLAERGWTREHVDELLVDNPARIVAMPAAAVVGVQPAATGA